MELLVLIPTFAAASGAMLALLTFHRAQRAKRVEWLWRLHHAFFVSTAHRQVRHLLDVGSPARIERLERAIAGAGDDELAEAFVDFLNYFEFIGALHHLGELRLAEAELVVGYYFDVLDRHAVVRSFIAQYGFEHTASLLAATRPRRLPSST